MALMLQGRATGCPPRPPVGGRTFLSAALSLSDGEWGIERGFWDDDAGGSDGDAAVHVAGTGGCGCGLGGIGRWLVRRRCLW